MSDFINLGLCFMAIWLVALFLYLCVVLYPIVSNKVRKNKPPKSLTPMQIYQCGIFVGSALTYLMFNH